MPLANKEKRLQEIELVLNQFKVATEAKYGFEIIYEKDSITKIVDTYELILDGVIKRFLPETSRAEIYKVASGLEVSTLYVQPILHNDPGTKKLLNAALSASVATHFVFQCTYDEIEYRSSNDGLNEEVGAIYVNHIDWLLYGTLTELFDFPIFSNAIFWRTFAALYDTQNRI